MKKTLVLLSVAVAFATCCNNTPKGIVIEKQGVFSSGGNAKVVYLPDEGITGNSHFMFQEKNNDVIADYIANWLKTINL